MNDIHLKMQLRRIERRQDIIMEQLSALSKVIANHLGLAIEEGEDGDIYDVERTCD